MPPPITPHIFMIPDNPNISWATIMLAVLIVIDVSTQIGEYHSAVKKSPKWSHDARAACKAINIVALRVVTVGMIIVVFSALIVTRLTMGMDSRMVLVLEGISRLEAAYLVCFNDSLFNFDITSNTIS